MLYIFMRPEITLKYSKARKNVYKFYIYNEKIFLTNPDSSNRP